MKPKNWRRYFWYRPPPLSYPAKDPTVTHQQYIEWLCQSRHWEEDRAEEYVRRMSSATRTGGTIDGHDCKTYERKVTYLCTNVAVRTVPCFTAAQGRHMPHCHGRAGGAGVTVYWVTVNGRQVDSYLTSARAMERAKELSRRLAAE